MATEAQMNVTPSTKLVREGDLLAEVHVELLEDEDGWSPYLSLDDANKLDDVREALRQKDLPRAEKLSDRIYRLTPLAVPEC
ncbi:MAG TPA: hypothetical protein VG323_10715 [Thermoanaerobaculia bacterium]|nr:hypothetical protein [Thermoanaerobaculia bacterium]